MAHTFGADLPRSGKKQEEAHFHSNDFFYPIPALFTKGLFPGETASCRASHGAMVTLSGPAGKMHLLSSRGFFPIYREDSGSK